MSTDPDRADVDVQTARLGALLASKGLTPDQVATVMKEQVQPALAEAVERTERGEHVEFVIRHQPRLPR
ncbi:hypothetical protein [Amycolatopsis sp. lyj-23]|uniref:hypothetical protein n=1 Tax=Amycolatopsis sp. lyj-23 TaxID=2789283 RepID=UPI00397C0267